MRKLGIALIALIMASGAQAAPPKGSRSDPRAVRVMHDIAACQARSAPGVAAAILASDFRSKDYDRRLRELSRRNPACISRLGRSLLRFNAVLFAGGVAEALLAHQAGGRTLAQRIAFDASRPNLEVRNAAEYMAICVVRRAPAESAALFATTPSSTEETAALRTVGPFLSGCVAAGETARLTRESIRSLLALAAWRLAAHNTAPVAAGRGG